MRLIFGCLVFTGVASWSSFHPAVDLILCAVLGGSLVVALLWGLGSWVAGEVSLHFVCVQSDPVAPMQAPVYAPRVKERS